MKKLMTSLGCLALLTVVGCNQNAETTDPSADTSANGDTRTVYVATEEPEGALDVIAARDKVKDGDDIVITGRIGGSESPWIDGRLTFPIVDGSLKACSDIEGDGCKTPWDYCCETDKLPGATALVKVVDKDGKAVSGDPKKMLNVKELSTVVVKGKAKRDEAGNLTVLTDQIYVKE